MEVSAEEVLAKDGMDKQSDDEGEAMVFKLTVFLL
jgi:hypothetical protein